MIWENKCVLRKRMLVLRTTGGELLQLLRGVCNADEILDNDIDSADKVRLVGDIEAHAPVINAAWNEVVAVFQATDPITE